MINKKHAYLSFSLFVLLFFGVIGCSSSTDVSTTTAPQATQQVTWENYDTVKAGKFDTGKMWTFDFPPVDYFAQEYGFRPSQDWLDNVRMSALRFANYCSASFVSEDGLVMTNHHCARQSVTQVTDLEAGEDLHKTGFFAKTLEDERKVAGLYVDQLVLITDITSEVQTAIDEAKAKNAFEGTSGIFKTITEKYKQTYQDLQLSVVTFFKGGKYSLYGFKRYNDVRLVFAPETELGFFGGDPDNFTYPRYALDCSFFRVYDETGKPLKTNHFYKWSPAGAAPGEPVFVVGNPGTTNRLHTMAQLEYQRDMQYPLTMELLNGLVKVYTEIINEFPDRKFELQDQLFGISNSQKAYSGILKGLRDGYLMAKKKDFEKNFKDAVNKNPNLKTKYGHIWDAIAATRAEAKAIAGKNFAYNLSPFTGSQYFAIAKNLVGLMKQLNLPEDQREETYKSDMLESTMERLFPESFDKALANKMLAMNFNLFKLALGANDPLVQKLTGGKSGSAAVDYALSNSSIKTKEGFMELAKKGADAIKNSNDPFIQFVLATADEGKKYSDMMKGIANREADFSQQLGRAVFEVYGTSIPPDATFSLRIADGVVKGYDYNGTTAPTMTTFYGLYDRFYSFKKEEPWALPERWQNPSADFDLHTPVNFVSTNDIIGGNSGSPVINKNAEVVGLAFDGNIESLPGQFIFTTEYNRTVSVHSAGMLEAIQDLYLAKRLSEELKHGKIVDSSSSSYESVK